MLPRSGMRAVRASSIGVVCALACVSGCGGVLDEDEASANPLLDLLTPPTCAEPTTAPDGHHRPGEDCLGCHRQGGDGTPYTLAGTLYADAGGTSPAAGITLHLMDAAGGDLVVVTAANGNFWSTDPVAAPAVAYAAQCPTVVPMQTPLAGGDMSCNRGGCHTTGFRMHP